MTEAMKRMIEKLDDRKFNVETLANAEFLENHPGARGYLKAIRAITEKDHSQ